jgi:hypothetical protein
MWCLLQPAHAVSYSKPELVSASSGLLRVDMRGSTYRGSATVARDPRLLYTCAHVLYDRGRWASDYAFHRAWHAQKFPSKSAGVAPRGFHYFSAYDRAARYTNGESNAAFANDFTVLYGNSSFGPAMEVRENSGPLLAGGGQKRIIGYPADIDYTGRSGFSYQHSTGWFATRAIPVRGPLYDLRGVSTGPGNSGGGIHLRDAATGREQFAGVLVAGSRRTAGVVAMNASTRSLSDDALGSAGTAAWASANANPIVLNGARPLASRALSVQEEGTVEGELTLQVEWAAPLAALPMIWLQSPSGRIRRVDPSASIRAFDGASIAGTWRIILRTQDERDVAYTRATLSGTARRAVE